MGGGGKALSAVQWRPFCIGETFRLTASRSGLDKNKIVGEDGAIPYITRSANDNGCNDFIKEQVAAKDGPCVITIGLDTQTVFYQPFAFYTGQNVHVLSNEKIDRHSALFIIPLLKKQLSRFSWGSNGATLGRLMRSNIILPSDSDGNPDWAFMRHYMMLREARLIGRYLEHFAETMPGMTESPTPA